MYESNKVMGQWNACGRKVSESLRQSVVDVETKQEKKASEEKARQAERVRNTTKGGGRSRFRSRSMGFGRRF